MLHSTTSSPAQHLLWPSPSRVMLPESILSWCTWVLWPFWEVLPSSPWLFSHWLTRNLWHQQSRNLRKLMGAEMAAEEFLPLFFLLLTSCPVGAPFIMKYAENCWVSNDLNSLSQDKTQLAKNVNNLCVDNNERENTRKKEFVFHSLQCCSRGFALPRTATPDYPRWTHLHGDLPLTL